VPTGSVTFTSNGGVIGTATLFGGVAVLNTTLPFLNAGFGITVIANYSGDGNYAPSTSNPVTLNAGFGVGGAGVGLSVSSTPNPSVVGQAVTFTATLAGFGGCGFGAFGGCAPGICGGVICGPGGCPIGVPFCNPGVCPIGVPFCNPGAFGGVGGTVGFVDGNTTIGIATIVGGVASFTTSGLAAGTHTIAAVLGGGAFNFAPTATSFVTQTVNPGVAGTTTTGVLGVTILSGVGTPPSEGLTPGCNQVTLRASPNTSIGALVALVSPFGSVAAIWRFDNGVKIFLAGYFGTAGAPTDIGVTIGGTESYFFCVIQVSTITSQ
jgi:hypothetical protein